METITLPLFNNWTEENISPCDWSNYKRYKNYFAVVVMNAEGKEERVYCEISDEYDLFFNVSPVKVNDIMVASCWDKRKERQYKHYYIVVEKTTSELVLAEGTEDVDFTTYRKTFKALQSIIEKAA